MTEDSEVVPVNHEKLGTLIDRTYETKTPLMVWGTTGIGKSEEIRRKAKQKSNQTESREFVEWNETDAQTKEQVIDNPEEYFVYADIRLSQFDPSDIKGIPDLEDDSVEWKAPKWVYAICQDGAKGVVFLDECNLAPPQVQASFYQLILDRQAGSRSISDEIYMIGAGNRAEDRANVYEMAAPLRNRFMHCKLEIPRGGSDGNWIDWAVDAGIDEDIIGYISSSVGEPELMKFSKNKDAKAFPTPRTWEMLSEQIEDLDPKEDREEIQLLASATIGRGTARGFIGFIERRDEVEDLEVYLQNPEKIQELDRKSNSVDLKHSVISALAARYKDNPGILENLVEIGTYLEKEFAILLLRMAKRYHPKKTKRELPKLDGFEEEFNDFTKFLVDDEG